MHRSLPGVGVTVVLLALFNSGCIDRHVDKPGVGRAGELPQYFPQTLEKDIDILFVIDNSGSMAQEQENLVQNFPKLIEALRSPKLDNKIPNVHIGVVTSDLGAGPNALPFMDCPNPGGDGAKLQFQRRVDGCTPPSDPFISYIEGQTNIPGSAADPIEQVKSAFQCIAKVGDKGCGFEHQLEAARRALDPGANVNPGFLREDAFLALVFITDEDDCSARRPELFDPHKLDLGNPDSFRCFEYGIECDINDRNQVGLRNNCKPGRDWLHKVDDYIKFFTETIKPPGRVLTFAITGDPKPVKVGKNENGSPALLPSCQSVMGQAVPALRIQSFIEGFGQDGYFNVGTDAALTQNTPVNICSSDYSPALRLLGRKIVAKLGGQCVAQPPLTRGGAIVCHQGDSLGPNKTCRQSCLHQVDCTVQEVVNQGTKKVKETVVQKCADALFDNPSSRDCGTTCPCWRIVPKPDTCKPERDGSPYAFEILRKGEPEKGAVAVTRCSVAQEPWGSAPFLALPQCE